MCFGQSLFITIIPNCVTAASLNFDVLSLFSILCTCILCLILKNIYVATKTVWRCFIIQSSLVFFNKPLFHDFFSYSFITKDCDTNDDTLLQPLLGYDNISRSTVKKPSTLPLKSCTVSHFNFNILVSPGFIIIMMQSRFYDCFLTGLCFVFLFSFKYNQDIDSSALYPVEDEAIELFGDAHISFRPGYTHQMLIVPVQGSGPFLLVNTRDGK